MLPLKTRSDVHVCRYFDVMIYHITTFIWMVSCPNWWAAFKKTYVSILEFVAWMASLYIYFEEVKRNVTLSDIPSNFSNWVALVSPFWSDKLRDSSKSSFLISYACSKFKVDCCVTVTLIKLTGAGGWAIP